MSLDEIIVQVQSRPELWCSSHPCFKNRAIHKRTWRHISKELDIDEITLKKRWKHLKDQYRKELKKAKNAHNGEIPDDYLSCWQWFPSLSFLKDEILNGSVKVNKSVLVSDTDTQSDDAEDNSPTKKFKQNVENAANKSLDSKKVSIIMKRVNAIHELVSNKRTIGLDDATKNDTDYMFLMSLLPSMKQLTEIQKLHFRGKINDWLIEAMTQNEYNNGDSKFFFHTQVAELQKEEED
ncbi:transcription factor Adf-1 [Amyelois transitella]|uniref:transcription factor Adf-1 n=1 Tax=Amyelois transitella TaxID=680683 RepID=UPI00067BF6D4|nr:transcription factor Adf-1 [Amyelois transitella]